MKFMSFRNMFLAVVATILLGGIGGMVWLGQSPPSQPVDNVLATPETVMFVPRETPFMVSLLLNAGHLKRAGLAVLSSGQRRQVQSDLNELQRRIDKQFGINYDTDLESWAGEELTFALTSWDIDRNPDNGATPGFLLAVSVWDAEQAEQSLQRLWQRQSRNRDLVVEEYSGVKIVFPDGFLPSGIPDADTPLVATAQVGRHYVLFANSPNVLRNAVNTLQANQLSLGSSTLYQDTISHLPNERFGLVWLNIPTAQSWLALQQVADEETMPTDQLIKQVAQSESRSRLPFNDAGIGADGEATEFNSVQIVATTLAIAPAGIVAETVLIPSLGKSFSTHTANSVETLDALRYIPTDSSLVITSHALTDIWKQLTHLTAQGNPLAQQITHALIARQEEELINTHDDVLPWAIGDYALARVPSDSKSGDASDADWIVVLSSSDKAQMGIHQLDTIAQKQGFNVDALQIGDQKTSIWTQLNAVLHPESSTNPVSLETEVQGIHASTQNWEILSTSVRALGKGLLLQHTNLANSTNFQKAIAALDPENDGYLYIDWDLAQTALTEAFPELSPILDIGQPILRPMRSLMITRYGSQSDRQRFGIVLQFYSDIQVN